MFGLVLGVLLALAVPAASQQNRQLDTPGLSLPSFTLDEAVPVAVRDGVLHVKVDDLQQRPLTGMLDLNVSFGAEQSPRVPAGDDSALSRFLRGRMRDPGIAGNHGDLYDNRDRGHSRLRLERHPGLTATRYEARAREAGLDQSLNTRLRFGAPTIGNASLAVTAGPFWRSLPRLAMTTPGSMQSIARLYEANHLYVYPAHQDFGRRHGDLMPATAPYFITSLGSSRSDQPFLAAFARIYSAYRPAVKARLVELGLLASTTQMILRRGMEGAGAPEAYMSPAGHPSAFDGDRIRLRAMVRFANDLTIDTIPPMVRLQLRQEAWAGPRNDMFADGYDEILFDTPGAIGRFALGSAGLRRYVLDVGATRDPNDRPLQFHWRLTHGNPERVRIVPQDEGGRQAVVTIWSPPSTEADTDRRVDIAVFADNGVHLSAPAFFGLAFPLGERRMMREDGAPIWIDYRLSEGAYSDPAIQPRRRWRDDYHYGPDGQLRGWTRTRDGKRYRYDSAGRRVGLTTERRENRPGTRITYPVEDRNGVPFVRERGD